MSGADTPDVLDEEPELRRAANARAIDELVQQERTRQDARLSALRRLRGDAAALFAADDHDDDKGGLGARVAGMLKRRRAPSEEELRLRYEEAQLRARRAAVFAEALAGLEGELHDEVGRMRALLVDLAHDEKSLDALWLRVRSAADEALSLMSAHGGRKLDAVVQRELEARVDAARARAAALEGQRERLRAAEDRLLALLESERMLAERLGVLRGEVERAARDAARVLDDMADQLRALATTSDARRVVRALEGSLAQLFSSLSLSAKSAADALEDGADTSEGGKR